MNDRMAIILRIIQIGWMIVHGDHFFTHTSHICHKSHTHTHTSHTCYKRISLNYIEYVLYKYPYRSLRMWYAVVVILYCSYNISSASLQWVLCVEMLIHQRVKYLKLGVLKITTIDQTNHYALHIIMLYILLCSTYQYALHIIMLYILLCFMQLLLLLCSLLLS